MRYWGKNIMIAGDWILYSAAKDDDNLAANPDAAGFEQRMQGALRYVQRNPVGAIVLDALNAAPHSVSIRPVTESAQYKSSARQISVANSKELGEPASPTPGPGSSVVIWYNTSGSTYGGHVYRVDDGLLHECFHALRQTRGRWRKTEMAGDWENLEEFLAIMVANIYASCDKRPGDMRSGHSRKFAPMTLTADAFKQQFRAQLLSLRNSMSDVYGALASAPADWNPLAALEKDLRPGR